MRCDAVRERLADVAGGHCGPWTRSRVRRHLEGCEACATALRSEEELDGLLRLWDDAEPSEGVWLRIREAVASPFAPETPTVPWWERVRDGLVRWGLPYGLGVATTVLLLLALGVGRPAAPPAAPDGGGGDDPVWVSPAARGEVLAPDRDGGVLVIRDRRYYDLLRRLPAEEILDLRRRGILQPEPEETAPLGQPAGYRTH